MDMKKMMREAQKMQVEMAKAQDEIAQMTVEGTAGGGVVKVVATGNLVIESVTIDPGVIDADDADMLQDLVLAAVNEALRQAQELANTRMNAITGGIGLPF
jgi:DNA-binding YbaB/EbfC family protein